MTHEEFMREVRKANEWRRHPEKWTEAERLRERIISGPKKDKEWMHLRKDVVDFLRSNASEEDKKMLMAYTETLHMVCNAIDKDRTTRQ
ncbi:MAG: hypothetical protein KH452_05980 [Clostridiales bacterium]|nr:hypothetical protein [Clostridiales bacterium]